MYVLYTHRILLLPMTCAGCCSSIIIPCMEGRAADRDYPSISADKRQRLIIEHIKLINKTWNCVEDPSLKSRLKTITSGTRNTITWYNDNNYMRDANKYVLCVWTAINKTREHWRTSDDGREICLDSRTSWPTRAVQKTAAAAVASARGPEKVQRPLLA